MKKLSLVKSTLLIFSLGGMLLMLTAIIWLGEKYSPEILQKNKDLRMVLYIPLFFLLMIPGQFIGGFIGAFFGKFFLSVKKEELESVIFGGVRLRFVGRWNRLCISILYGAEGNFDKIFEKNKFRIDGGATRIVFQIFIFVIIFIIVKLCINYFVNVSGLS